MTDRYAYFSPDRKYRYQLTRIWHHYLPMAMCIGLNPSTATEDVDDPTISLLCRKLPVLGFGGLKMMNLYGLVTDDPKILFSHPNPMGDNEKWLQETAHGCQTIIFCWGNFPKAKYRADRMQQLFPGSMCFGHTKSGAPWHPLAMMYAGMKGPEVNLVPFKKPGTAL